ncbi:MAG: KH domain-containing protein [Bacilli bacterium]|nr:KH domain-containing protein [Bacilli bacterium]
MEIINREGKELETVLNDVCSELNVERNDFYYKYTEKKSGLFNKNSTVSVDIILKNELVIYIKDYLEELLNNMGLEANFETKLREDIIYVKIYSSNNPVLIGKGGNTLKALETLVKQKINTDFNIRPFISLDVENYREKQQKRLERLAKNLAKEVSKTNVEVHLENMNAYDRRIIHNALTNFKGVSTTSVGEEPNRHVVIKPE